MVLAKRTKLTDNQTRENNVRKEETGREDEIRNTFAGDKGKTSIGEKISTNNGHYSSNSLNSDRTHKQPTNSVGEKAVTTISFSKAKRTKLQKIKSH